MNSLTHLFTQLFCLSFVLSPPLLTPPRLPHFSASSSVSPHMPFSPFFLAPVFSLCLSPRLFSSLLIFFSSSHSSFELHGRNRAWCQLDERGHGGPADLVMLSHHDASLSVSLSHAHTKKRFSQISLSTCFSLCCATLTSSDSSEES